MNINGVKMAAMVCEDHINSSVTIVERMLKEDGDEIELSKFRKKAAKRPFPKDYRP